jgi:hypothetical protein
MPAVEAQLRHLYNRPSIQERTEIQRERNSFVSTTTILGMFKLRLHKTVHRRPKASETIKMSNSLYTNY